MDYANGSSGRFTDNSPKEFKRLADGRLEMTFQTFLFPTHHDCWPEAIAETGIVTGYGYGISNVDNTEMEIEIVYKNRHGTVFNTTNLYLWK